VVYINPPYAEVSSIREKGKAGVNKSKIHDKYFYKLGTAGREVYIMFLVRIFEEVNGCYLAEFSKLKALQGSAFDKFRKYFKAKLVKSFIVPAYTFDNVKGNFPIGFKIWNTAINDIFYKIKTDVYDENNRNIGTKTLNVVNKQDFINKWITKFKTDKDYIGFLAGTNGNDFQQNNIVYIINLKEQMANPRGIWISEDNLKQVSIYYSVRHCIAPTWLNDRDQFLYPKKKWEKDKEYQNDCLAFALFHGQNRISSKDATNHWIPFTESEVNAREKFESNFMNKFIDGKKILSKQPTQQKIEISKEKGKKDKKLEKLEFSPEAKAVFDAGRELWKYYHTNFAKVLNFGKVTHAEYNVNASLYDIRAYFQGRNESGKMNNKSEDETYTSLIANLRDSLKTLAQKIEPKVYEYEFLKE
jgi:hypothetical protein